MPHELVSFLGRVQFVGHGLGAPLLVDRQPLDHVSHDRHCLFRHVHGPEQRLFDELHVPVVPGDEVTYQLGETLNGLTTSITVTANATGDGSSIGDIGDTVLDTLEFDTVYGHMPAIIHVSGDIYAVAYRGSGNDGFLKTVEIASDGSITNSVIDTLEFDTAYGIYADIIHISGNIYAIAYQGNGNDGFLKTVEIASDGNITNSVVDTLEFDNRNGREPSIIHISNQIYAIAYRGNGGDGFIKTVEIATNGDITNSVVDSFEYDTRYGRAPDIIHVSGDIYASAYCGNGNDGFIKTVEIASDGNITNGVLDTLEYDTAYSIFADIIHISGDIYAITYQGPGNDGFLKTVEIASDGNITNSVVDTLEFDTGNGRSPDIIHVSGDVYAIAYRGNGGDGFIKTVEIASNGDITSAVVDTLEFDTSYGYFPDTIHISGGIYAIAYCGPGTDGFIKTVEIATTSGASASYEIVSTAGDSTIRAFVNTANETSSIVSWQIE